MFKCSMITPLESIKHAHKSSSNASFTCVSPIISGKSCASAF
uniref:Uncharacterized protein n=1 Tax=Anguilla anguilla TaxID=7936 RepID=A0A0E9SNI4_ANGAN